MAFIVLISYHFISLFCCRVQQDEIYLLQFLHVQHSIVNCTLICTTADLQNARIMQKWNINLASDQHLHGSPGWPLPLATTPLLSALRSLTPLETSYKKTHVVFVHLWLASVQFSSVQSLSRVRLFATPWIAAYFTSNNGLQGLSSLCIWQAFSHWTVSHCTHIHTTFPSPVLPSVDVQVSSAPDCCEQCCS